MKHELELIMSALEQIKREMMSSEYNNFMTMTSACDFERPRLLQIALDASYKYVDTIDKLDKVVGFIDFTLTYCSKDDK